MSCNTSTSGGGNGNDGGGDDILYSKKLKRQKIPKRGPGVAELEKILRDQERQDDHLDGSSSLKNADPFSVDHEQFITPPYGGNVRGSSLSLGVNNYVGEGDGGAHGRRSGIALPENALLPAMWSSHEINSTDRESTKFTSGFTFSTQIIDGSSPIIPSLVIPQKHRQYLPAMLDPFGHSGLSSSLQSAVGEANYHHIEPPSNQISCCQYSNAWPEQEKMVHTKRHWPFSTNNPVDSPLLYQFSSYLPYKHQIEQSTSCGNNERAFNLEGLVEFSREIKSKSSVTAKRCSTDRSYRAPDGSIFMLGSPETPIINGGSGQEVIKFEALPFQGTMESCQSSMERRKSSGPGQAGLVHKKPFYSFFATEVMDSVDTSVRLKTERVEARGDGIDLNLRL